MSNVNFTIKVNQVHEEDLMSDRKITQVNTTLNLFKIINITMH